MATIHAYSAPGSQPSASQASAHLFLTTIPGGREWHYPHSTDEKLNLRVTYPSNWPKLVREELGSRIGQCGHCLHTVYTAWRDGDMLRYGGNVTQMQDDSRREVGRQLGPMCSQ